MFNVQHPLYGTNQSHGFALLGGASALVAASIWRTSPSFLEVQVDLRVAPKAEDFALQNIVALDLSRNSFLSPVPSSYVAWAAYPTAGQAPPAMPIAAPVPIGAVGVASSSGTFTGYRTGPSFSGNYTGNTVGSVASTYDYTLTNISLA